MGKKNKKSGVLGGEAAVGGFGSALSLINLWKAGEDMGEEVGNKLGLDKVRSYTGPIEDLLLSGPPGNPYSIAKTLYNQLRDWGIVGKHETNNSEDYFIRLSP